MRVGVLITSLGDFGKKGFYNLQEIGLAKSIDSFFDEIKIYKLVSFDQKEYVEQIESCKNSFIYFIPAKGFGSNGKLDVRILDPTLDALICFSDTQFAVPKIYKWAKKNNVRFYPYIGVIESHSVNRLKQILVNFMSKRNIAVFRKCHCLVKTPKVKEDLQRFGVKKITLAPVGLDLDLMKKNYKDYRIDDLKSKFGYKCENNILLFIGRLIDEKQPERMIRIFSQVLKKDKNSRLLMVGMGPLKEVVEKSIRDNGLLDKVQMIDRVPNNEIWVLYRMANVFINLNQAEIFGMAILEAMYYECKIVAWEAPGPNFIIENGISGWLVDNDRDVVAKILDNKDLSVGAKNRVMSDFTWERTGRMFKDLLENPDVSSGNALHP